MARLIIPDSASHPLHITARCINKEWFSIPLPEVWNVMENYLYFINRAYEIKIHAFVLMPNHFHLIASQPEKNMSEAMNYFMRETSRQISRSAGRINQTYGARFHRSLITNEKYFYQAYKYVYRNPVKAKLCEKVEDHAYSTLKGLIGSQKLIVPVEEDLILFNEGGVNIAALDWLNEFPATNAERGFTPSSSGLAVQSVSTSDGTSGSDTIIPGDNNPGDGTCDPKDKPSNGSDPSAIVECDMGSSNAKIVLSGSLLIGSNAQQSRICMSQNSCLNLVNSYAQSRSCKLSLGAAVNSGSKAQCTSVFPGSQGTCKNAQVLSDADVVQLLSKMSQ